MINPVNGSAAKNTCNQKAPLTLVPGPIGRSLVINKPGHRYDTRRVTLETIFSERQRVLVHVEGHIYTTLRYDDVVAVGDEKPARVK